MLFYEYFRKHLNSQVKITLKNDMLFTGTLKSVDVFLNIRIDPKGLPSTNPALKDIEMISFRGSSIKYIDLEANEKLDQRLSQATYLSLALMNK